MIFARNRPALTILGFVKSGKVGCFCGGNQNPHGKMSRIRKYSGLILMHSVHSVCGGREDGKRKIGSGLKRGNSKCPWARTGKLVH